MNFKEFKIVIETLQNISERSHSLYRLGLDLLDYDEPHHKVFSILLNSIFKEQGKDWIDWYLYERVGFKEDVLKATDENGNEICHNIKSLWETVKPYIKQ
jgi:hypothetical protein